MLSQWLLRATLQGSLLVCLILVIKLALRERLPARWHYCLWLVLLVRLSLPWAPQSRLSIYNLVPRPFSSHDTVSAPADGANSDAAGARPGPEGQEKGMVPALPGAQDKSLQRGQDGAAVSAPPVVALRQSDGGPGVGHRPFAESVADGAPWLWLGGCLVLGGYILLRAFGLWSAVRSERPVTDQQILDLLEDGKMQMRVRTLVGVVVTDQVRTPALFGFLRPRILLPQGLIETLGLDGLQCVFLHELAHLKRRDIYLAWLVCLLQVLHWFNPLIWLAFRRMRADQEMAADALALAVAGAGESRRYGQTIVSLLERFSRPQYLPSLAGILESPSHIERRMTMIAKFNSTPHKPMLVTALLAVLALIALTDAQSKPAPQTNEGTAVMPSKDAPAAPQVAEKAPLGGDSDTFIDPKTEITLRKTKTLAGPNDVDGLSFELSRSGRLLLDTRKLEMVPLVGGRPFKLVDLRWAQFGTWSPDGREVAFWACPENTEGAVWVVHVDPDTGRPTAPPARLADCPLGEWFRWTHDSNRIIFRRDDKETHAALWWTVSMGDGITTQITDFSTAGIPSPDGQYIAYSENPTYRGDFANSPAKPLWVKSTRGGPARRIDNAAAPWAWSSDGKWIYCFDANRPCFVRAADGQTVVPQWMVDLPWRMRRLVPGPLDRGKLYSLETSWNDRRVLKVVSASGGPAYELGTLFGGGNKAIHWSPDSQAVMVEGTWSKSSNPSLQALALDGGKPIFLRNDASIPGVRFMSRLSPDCKHLLIAASDKEGADGPWDVWVVPVSWQEMRTTGPAVVIFKGWNTSDYGGPARYAFWSPDGKKIALPDGRGSIYVVAVAGGDPVQLTTGNQARWLYWSPDGTMIAFVRNGAISLVQVIPSTGGEAKTVCSRTQGAPLDPMDDILWSPDSQALIVMRDQGPVSVSIADGSTRSLVNMDGLGKGAICALRLSADGTTLAFLKWYPQDAHEDDQLCLLDMHSAKMSPLMRVVGNLRDHRWSPNGKWIASIAEESYKARSGSVLWEMDIEEALAKLAK